MARKKSTGKSRSNVPRGTSIALRRPRRRHVPALNLGARRAKRSLPPVPPPPKRPSTGYRKTVRRTLARDWQKHKWRLATTLAIQLKRSATPSPPGQPVLSGFDTDLKVCQDRQTRRQIMFAQKSTGTFSPPKRRSHSVRNLKCPSHR